MALINTDSFYVAGYFEEIKLERIHIGDAAVISPMGSSLSLDGHVESITYGINDRERDRDSLLVDINPTFSWVRLAQRIQCASISTAFHKQLSWSPEEPSASQSLKAAEHNAEHGEKS